MSAIRDAVLATPIDAAVEAMVAETEEPEDEIVAALKRQLDVMHGSLVVLGNMVQLLMAQVENLGAEVDLLSTPVETIVAPEWSPRPDLKTTPRGAVVEASLPEEKRLPDFCLHDDAIVIDTVDGRQRLCPTCEAEREAERDASSD